MKYRYKNETVSQGVCYVSCVYWHMTNTCGVFIYLMELEVAYLLCEMVINFTWGLTMSLLNCLPKFMLKVIKTTIIAYIGNESFFINICTCFCISERMTAKYNSSNRSKHHKPKRSEKLSPQLLVGDTGYCW